MNKIRFDLEPHKCFKTLQQHTFCLEYLYLDVKMILNQLKST